MNKYTIIGFFTFKETREIIHTFTEWREADNPQDAARQSYADRRAATKANNIKLQQLNIIAVFSGKLVSKMDRTRAVMIGDK